MLTANQIARIAIWDPDLAAALGDAMHAVDVMSAAGAVRLDTLRTKLQISGTQALTLANGTVAGQRKIVSVDVAASTPAATLTITTPDATAGYVCAGSFFFDTVGQELELLWTGSAWRAVRIKRAGGLVNNVVVGTTVLTGLNMWLNYYLSVTGTVASTTTKGIPNGSAIGERIIVGVSTAAAIPSGTISLAGVTTLGGAATTLGTVGATTNFAVLEWNGSAWQLVGNTTLVLS